MAAVKGSKQHRMIVVPYRPLLRVALMLIGGALVAAAVYGSYFFGYHKGTSSEEQVIEERDKLQLAYGESVSEVETLRQELANVKLGADVDRQSSENVRQEVIALKSQITELQEDISFYRGLMSPSGNKRGLTIGPLDLVSSGAPRRYNYKLVMQQLAENHVLLSHRLTFKVIGRLGEMRVAYPLSELSEQVSKESIKLRFKYFQNIQGELVLPEGFEPDSIELVAKSSGRNSATVEKRFGWLVQEN